MEQSVHRGVVFDVGDQVGADRGSEQVGDVAVAELAVPVGDGVGDQGPDITPGQALAVGERDGSQQFDRGQPGLWFGEGADQVGPEHADDVVIQRGQPGWVGWVGQFCALGECCGGQPGDQEAPPDPVGDLGGELAGALVLGLVLVAGARRVEQDAAGVSADVVLMPPGVLVGPYPARGQKCPSLVSQ